MAAAPVDVFFIGFPGNKKQYDGSGGNSNMAGVKMVISSRRGFIPAGAAVRGASHSVPACSSGRRSGCPLGAP